MKVVLSRPEGMDLETWTRIGKLPSAKRDRVVERSCILFFGGAVATWREADERALAEEGISTQQRIGGEG